MYFQVDVVFIHGLLGGVFYTWRQQDTANSHELSDDQVCNDDDDCNDDVVGHNEDDDDIEQVSEEDYSFCWPRDWLAEDSNHVSFIFISYVSHSTVIFFVGTLVTFAHCIVPPQGEGDWLRL